MATPNLTIVRFRTDHAVNYQGNEPTTHLYSRKGYVTTGFIRGTGLAVGQVVHANSSNGHGWVGWITAQGLPDFYTRDGGDTAWFFVLYIDKEATGAGSPGDLTVTVTVTDPNAPTDPSNTLTANPTPVISNVP